MIRVLGIEPSSQLALHGLRLTNSNYTAYRSWLVNRVCRNLLPIEHYRVTTGNSSNVELNPATGFYRIQYDNSKIEGKDLYEILDIQLGYLIHECAHVIYTDFKEQEKYLLMKKSKEPKLTLDALHGFWNMIEDVRIETRISVEIPGSGDYIQKTRLQVSRETIEARKNKPEEFGVIGLSSLVYMYYSVPYLFDLWIDDPKMNEYGYKREDIERICFVPYEICDVIKICDDLIDLMKESEKDDYKKHDMLNKLFQQLLQEFGRSFTDKLGKMLEDEADSKGRKSKKIAKNAKGAESDKELPESEHEKKVKNPDSKSDIAEQEKRESESESNFKPEFNEDEACVDINITEEESQLPECDDDVKMLTYFPADLNNESVAWKKVEWDRSDISNYDDIVRNVVGNSAAVLRAAFMKYNVGGWKTNTLLEDGKPDRRFIHRAMMDDTRIFKKLEKRVNAPLDVVILIDESGSMSDSGKYKRAREVAILIHEALLGIKNINYWCYGHTTGGWSGESADVIMSIYHEGPVKDVADKYKLMHIRADSGNCDGRAILESAGRVKRRISPDRNVLFILISDGAPTESCGGIRPDEYARKAAKYVQEQFKYNFIHVGIDCCNKNLYDVSIDYTNPNELSRRIGDVVSGFIIQNRQK